ncbi:MAG: hypothetical protein WD669_03395 [Pirellulales bacterium]
MFRISLRGLFALVACCALALVSLKYASDGWLAAVLGLAIIALLVAIIFVAGDRGPRQAFSLAFVLIVIGYGWIVFNFPQLLSRQQFGSYSEFQLSDGHLPTTVLLRHAYAAIVHERWINSSTGQEMPNFDRANQSIPIGNPGGGGGGGFGGFGGGGMGGGGAPIGPFAIHDVSPLPDHFARIGHVWWALLFGCVGARFGRFVYERRTSKRSPEV